MTSGAAISDLALADCCAQLYDRPESFAHLFSDEHCFAGVTHLDGASVIVYRGSTTMLDWYNDIDAMPLADPQLGPVHGGFFRGVRDWHQRILAVCEGEIYVTGHSLGAARAMLAGGLMIANGLMPAAIVAIGCPRPGFARLSEIVATCPRAPWYRNHHDPVTYVPWLGGQFVHPGTIRRVDIPGALDDPWLLLADHHLALYRQGIAAA